MPHAIIRGKNGRRHEVDFGDAPIRVEIYASDETVEIFVEADFETHAEERRRFAILNIRGALYPLSDDGSTIDHVLGAANCGPLRENEELISPHIRTKWL